MKSIQQAPLQGDENTTPMHPAKSWDALANHAAGIAVLSVEFEYGEDDLSCYPSLVTRFISRSKHA